MVISWFSHFVRMMTQLYMKGISSLKQSDMSRQLWIIRIGLFKNWSDFVPINKESRKISASPELIFLQRYGWEVRVEGLWLWSSLVEREWGVPKRSRLMMFDGSNFQTFTKSNWKEGNSKIWKRQQVARCRLRCRFQTCRAHRSTPPTRSLDVTSKFFKTPYIRMFVACMWLLIDDS